MSSPCRFAPHRRSPGSRGWAAGCVAAALVACVLTLGFPRRGVVRVQAWPMQAPNLTSQDSTRDIVELARRDLLIPVQGADRAQLVPSFAQARDGRLHEALDILSPRGTPVLAVETGTIAKLFTSKPGGLTIYQFDPSRRYAYYYAHLDRYADGLAGDKHVARGEVLGYVGTTGNADPVRPHLHFAIFKLGPEQRWWQGVAIDAYAVWTWAPPSGP